jgi:hypothetical protein
MVEDLLSIAVPWLTVVNVLLFGTLAAIWFIRGRYAEAVLFLWGAIGFALIAVPMLD